MAVPTTRKTSIETPPSRKTEPIATHCGNNDEMADAVVEHKASKIADSETSELVGGFALEQRHWQQPKQEEEQQQTERPQQDEPPQAVPLAHSPLSHLSESVSNSTLTTATMTPSDSSRNESGSCNQISDEKPENWREEQERARRSDGSLVARADSRAAVSVAEERQPGESHEDERASESVYGHADQQISARAACKSSEGTRALADLNEGNSGNLYAQPANMSPKCRLHRHHHHHCRRHNYKNHRRPQAAQASVCNSSLSAGDEKPPALVVTIPLDNNGSRPSSFDYSPAGPSLSSADRARAELAPECAIGQVMEAAERLLGPSNSLATTSAIRAAYSEKDKQQPEIALTSGNNQRFNTHSNEPNSYHEQAQQPDVLLMLHHLFQKRQELKTIDRQLFNIMTHYLTQLGPSSSSSVPSGPVLSEMQQHLQLHNQMGAPSKQQLLLPYTELNSPTSPNLLNPSPLLTAYGSYELLPGIDNFQTLGQHSGHSFTDQITGAIDLTTAQSPAFKSTLFGGSVSLSVADSAESSSSSSSSSSTSSSSGYGNNLFQASSAQQAAARKGSTSVHPKKSRLLGAAHRASVSSVVSEPNQMDELHKTEGDNCLQHIMPSSVVSSRLDQTSPLNLFKSFNAEEPASFQLPVPSTIISTAIQSNTTPGNMNEPGHHTQPSIGHHYLAQQGLLSALPPSATSVAALLDLAVMSNGPATAGLPAHRNPSCESTNASTLLHEHDQPVKAHKRFRSSWSSAVESASGNQDGHHHHSQWHLGQHGRHSLMSSIRDDQADSLSAVAADVKANNTDVLDDATFRHHQQQQQQRHHYYHHHHTNQHLRQQYLLLSEYLNQQSPVSALSPGTQTMSLAGNARDSSQSLKETPDRVTAYVLASMQQNNNNNNNNNNNKSRNGNYSYFGPQRQTSLESSASTLKSSNLRYENALEPTVRHTSGQDNQLAPGSSVSCALPASGEHITSAAVATAAALVRQQHQKIAYKCHVCGSGFEDRHRLQQHLSIHLNLHPSWFEERTIQETMAQYELKRGDYLCTLCNLRFETTAEFDKHMQLHGDKPHRCELCSQDSKLVSFRYYRQLLTHLRSHCFLYSCRFAPDCKQTSNRKDYLKLHILKHHLNNKLPEQYTVCCH